MTECRAQINIQNNFRPLSSENKAQATKGEKKMHGGNARKPTQGMLVWTPLSVMRLAYKASFQDILGAREMMEALGKTCDKTNWSKQLPDNSKMIARYKNRCADWKWQQPIDP